MDLLEQSKQLCNQYNIKPARSKGQNFLIDEKIYDKIVNSAELNKNNVILEVGPGLGFLTEKLARKVKKVITVELDDKLTNYLKTALIAKKINNVEVINEDIMKLDIGYQILRKKHTNIQYPMSNFKVVANLPYNITSIFLRKFLSADKKPNIMVLMLQKEVAERIVASPGKMSLLAVSVQYYAKPEIVSYVEKQNFWPEPAVDSAIINLTPRPSLLNRRGGKKDNEDKKRFFQLVKFGFSAKRKMLKNNLAGSFRISQTEAEDKIKKAGFSEKIRAQELSVSDWVKLLGEFE